MKTIITATICIGLLVVSCGEDVYESPYTPPKKCIYITKVISEPSGAKIELDGDYLGETPLEIEWEGWCEPERICGGLFTRDHTVIALPIHSGQYTQRKFFSGTPFRYRHKVPKTIFFNMRLGPIPTRYELEID